MFRVAHGTWLGPEMESDMHFAADSCGVFKSRSIRGNSPSKQSSLDAANITAIPWNPSGSKSETDAFIIPLSKDEDDDPQPLSEGASKEDFPAEELLDDYIEPESPLPDDLVDLRLKKAKWRFRRCRFLRDEVSPGGKSIAGRFDYMLNLGGICVFNNLLSQVWLDSVT